MAPPDATCRRDRARAAILDAAAELTAEAGYGKLSIEAITARAGVGEQTIHRWWPSKGAVLFDAFLQPQEDAGGIGLPETEGPHADLRLLLRETARGLVDPCFEVPYRAQVDAAVDPTIAVELVHGPLFHRWLLRTGPLDDAHADALAGHVHMALA